MRATPPSPGPWSPTASPPAGPVGGGRPSHEAQVSGATELEIVANEDLTASTTSSVTQSWTDDSSHGGEAESREVPAGVEGPRSRRAAPPGPGRSRSSSPTAPATPLVRLGETRKLPGTGPDREGLRPARGDKAASRSHLIWVMAVSVADVRGDAAHRRRAAASRGDSRATARMELSSLSPCRVSTLQPYQIYLRNAVAAHAQGDAANERRNYFASSTSWTPPTSAIPPISTG